MALVHERLSLHHDARNTLDARRHGRSDEREEADRDYHPCHDGRYDNGEARALTCRGLRPLADTSSTPPSGQGTDHQLTSQSTLGKQTSDYGSRITCLLAKMVERIMTISLFAAFHCSWLIRREHGWNTFCPTESKVGRT